MSTLVIETKITHKYLMNKSKWELADMYLQLLDNFDKLQKESGSVCGNCGGWLKGGECENCASPTVCGPTPHAPDAASATVTQADTAPESNPVKPAGS